MDSLLSTHTNTYISVVSNSLITDHWVILRSQEKLSCNNPPIGIQVDFINASNVTIQVYNIESSYFWGERPLKKPVTRYKGKEIGELLSPGNATGTLMRDVEEMRTYLSRSKDILTPPHVRAKFEIEFNRLGDSQRYIYNSLIEIPFDCINPEMRVARNIYEKIEPLNEK